MGLRSTCGARGGACACEKGEGGACGEECVIGDEEMCVGGVSISDHEFCFSFPPTDRSLPWDVAFLSIPVLHFQVLELRGDVAGQVHDGLAEQVHLQRISLVQLLLAFCFLWERTLAGPITSRPFPWES